MRVFVLLIFLLLLQLSLSAQPLSVSPTVLNFGEMDEFKLDSLPVTLFSNSNRIDTFSLRIPFTEFGSRPFRVKDSLIFIQPSASKIVWVYAHIKHNTINEGHLIVNLRSRLGNSECHIVPLFCQGKFSKSYYAQTKNLSEDALKSVLKSRLTQGQVNFSYDVARDKMYGFIDNVNDTVTCVYTNRKAKFNTRAGATSNNFNCEHTFPQGFFNSQLPMRSDIHHLFSTDEDANNSRGNLPFGVATPPLVQEAINAPSKNGGGRYEPQDKHKGNCARAMMYFVLRYQDYNNFYAPQDAQLRIWHKQFPPLPADTLRHSLIFQEQANRNPFVDYPQFADRIKSLTSFSASDSIQFLNLSSSEIYLDSAISGSSEGSICIWNEGNKVIQIQNSGFSQGRVEFLGNVPPTFSLGKNQARQISFRRIQAGPDTLKFYTNQVGLPSLQIPVRQSQLVFAQPSLFAKNVRVFPVPSSSFFAVEGLPHGTWVVSVSDVMGRKVFESAVESTQKPVYINRPVTVNGGIFILMAVSGDETFQQRIIFDKNINR